MCVCVSVCVCMCVCVYVCVCRAGIVLMSVCFSHQLNPLYVKGRSYSQFLVFYFSAYKRIPSLWDVLLSIFKKFHACLFSRKTCLFMTYKANKAYKKKGFHSDMTAHEFDCS